jgi:hypothetical protein
LYFYLVFYFINSWVKINLPIVVQV